MSNIIRFTHKGVRITLLLLDNGNVCQLRKGDVTSPQSTWDSLVDWAEDDSILFAAFSEILSLPVDNQVLQLIVSLRKSRVELNFYGNNAKAKVDYIFVKTADYELVPLYVSYKGLVNYRDVTGNSFEAVGLESPEVWYLDNEDTLHALTMCVPDVAVAAEPVPSPAAPAELVTDAAAAELFPAPAAAELVTDAAESTTVCITEENLNSTAFEGVQKIEETLTWEYDNNGVLRWCHPILRWFSEKDEAVLPDWLKKMVEAHPKFRGWVNETTSTTTTPYPYEQNQSVSYSTIDNNTKEDEIKPLTSSPFFDPSDILNRLERLEVLCKEQAALISRLYSSQSSSSSSSSSSSTTVLTPISLFTTVPPPTCISTEPSISTIAVNMVEEPSISTIVVSTIGAPSAVAKETPPIKSDGCCSVC